MTKRVLSVGNCSFDHGTIKELISANFDAPGASTPFEDVGWYFGHDGFHGTYNELGVRFRLTGIIHKPFR